VSGGQIDRTRAIIEKYEFKVTKLGIKKNLLEKEITLDFNLRFRATQPNRNMYQEVFGLEEIRQVELK